MKRQEVLETARQAVCQDRAETHGDLDTTFAVIADLWGAYLGNCFLRPRDVINMMVLLKVARARDNLHDDNWVDMAGYAACGAELDEIESVS